MRRLVDRIRFKLNCWRGKHIVKLSSYGKCIECGRQIDPPGGQIKFPVRIP